MLQHALCLKGGFGSAETCLKVEELVQRMTNMVFTLCAFIALLLPQSTYLPWAEQHSEFILILEPKV